MPSVHEEERVLVGDEVVGSFRCAECDLLITSPKENDGILVLPHLGGGHPQRGAAVAEIFVENARHYLAGETMKTVVDRPARRSRENAPVRRTH